MDFKSGHGALFLAGPCACFSMPLFPRLFGSLPSLSLSTFTTAPLELLVSSQWKPSQVGRSLLIIFGFLDALHSLTYPPIVDKRWTRLVVKASLLDMPLRARRGWSISLQHDLPSRVAASPSMSIGVHCPLAPLSPAVPQLPLMSVMMIFFQTLMMFLSLVLPQWTSWSLPTPICQ